MIVHTFVNRDDEYILPLHLEVYSKFCDKIIVVLDRSPQNRRICEQYACEIIDWTPDSQRPDFNERGTLFDEGIMRQAGLDSCRKYNPDYIVFGDTDEIPTPDIAYFINGLLRGYEKGVKLWYADWVNLIYNTRTAIGGHQSKWSFQRPESNKKGLILKYEKSQSYIYRVGLQHVRMEPNPLSETRAIVDEFHKLSVYPKLLHHKYVNWESWMFNPLSKTDYYRDLTKDIELFKVPESWHWNVQS